MFSTIKSIWGSEDKLTKNILNKTEIKGRWLNLCCGDGRYNNILLKSSYQVVCTDKSKNAMNILKRKTPLLLRKKLKAKLLDITKRFPFKDNYFDGIFCTGTLHLFSKAQLKKIVKEINRVLKPNGIILIDFATDIKRIKNNGKKFVYPKEPSYKLANAQNFLRQLFYSYIVKMYFGKVSPTYVKEKELYTFSCNFVLLKAIKKEYDFFDRYAIEKLFED